MIAQLLSVVSFVINNASMFIAAFVLVLAALIALGHALIGIFILIPGPHPEDYIQAAVDKLQGFKDFVAKFSKKPEEPKQ